MNARTGLADNSAQELGGTDYKVVWRIEHRGVAAERFVLFKES